VVGAPHRLDAADLDGDGDIDLFVVGRRFAAGAVLQVLANEGGGAFSHRWRAGELLSSSEEIWDADLADTDGDVDVVYVVPYGKPRQRFNDGGGAFNALGGVPTFSYQFEHAFADVDHDGRVNLLDYEPDDFNEIYFGAMKGAGDGSFAYRSAEVALFANVEPRRRIAVGDVTGDGQEDAVFTSLLSGGVCFFRGLPGGGFPGWAAPELVCAPGCADAVLADLDGDGRPEIVARCRRSTRSS
jgi:hypothetical protein